MNKPPANSDPRLLPEFDPRLLPQCDGGPLPPPETTHPMLRRVIAFAALYYAMNRAMSRVEAARLTKDAAAELMALNDLRRTSLSRDALEDRYAPEGFLAEPIMEGHRYSNLQFTWAGKSAARQVFTQRFEVQIAL